MSKQKVLILNDITGADSSPVINANTTVKRILERLGYSITVVTDENNIETIFSTLTLSDYDFMVIPNPQTSAKWAAGGSYWDGTSGLTCFVLGPVISGAVKFRDSFGADTNTGAAQLKWKWRGFDVWGHGADYTLNASLDTTVFVQEDSARGTGIKSWRLNGASSNVYVDSSGFNTGTHTFFTYLLQEAVDAGDIPKPPKRIPVYLDIDDFPTTKSTVQDVTNVYTLMTTYNIHITWGLTVGPTFNDTDAAAYMLSVQDSQYVHLIDHDGSFTFDGTIANIDTNYRAAISTLQGVGYNVGVDSTDDNFSTYRFFNTNLFDENGLMLMTPKTSIVADPLGATVMKGYGYKTARTDVGNTTANNIGEPGRTKGTMKRWGITILPSSSPLSTTDLSFAYDGDENANFGNAHYLTLGGGLASNTIFYSHMQNFYDGHDTGNMPGYYMFEFLAKSISECSDIFRSSHPSFDY